MTRKYARRRRDLREVRQATPGDGERAEDDQRVEDDGGDEHRGRLHLGRQREGHDREPHGAQERGRAREQARVLEGLESRLFAHGLTCRPQSRPRARGSKASPEDVVSGVSRPRCPLLGQPVESCGRFLAGAADHGGEVGRGDLSRRAEDGRSQIRPRVVRLRKLAQVLAVPAREDVEDHGRPAAVSLLAAGCGDDQAPLEPLRPPRAFASARGRRRAEARRCSSGRSRAARPRRHARSGESSSSSEVVRLAGPARQCIESRQHPQGDE